MVQGKGFSTTIHYFLSDLETALWIWKGSEEWHLFDYPVLTFFWVHKGLFSLIPWSHVITVSISPHPKEPSWGLANEKCCNSRNASPLAAIICILWQPNKYWYLGASSTNRDVFNWCLIWMQINSVHNPLTVKTPFFVAKQFFLFTHLFSWRSFFTMALRFYWFAEPLRIRLVRT